MSTNIYRAAIVILIGAVATLAILLTTHHTTPTVRTVHTVSDNTASYNDGFATAKQDDCQQHFAAACAWLSSN
jgi:hypothetical protein